MRVAALGKLEPPGGDRRSHFRGERRVRALVTGATGFVGAAVARALLRDGWQVRALARAGSDRSNLQSLALEIAIGDLNDPTSLEAAIADCRALFHVAADYRLGARDPADLYRTNVEGTRNILAAGTARGCRAQHLHLERRDHGHTSRRHPRR